MTKHYNPSIVERANRILASKSGDFLSDEVQGPVAVIPINPIINIVRAASATTTSSGTIFTTPTDKDFYLTGVQFGFVKDAACDAANTTTPAVLITIDGVSVTVVRLPTITLTAQNQSVFVSLPTPIKIDRGTTISIQSTSYTVGVFNRNAVIYGYTEEVTR